MLETLFSLCKDVFYPRLDSPFHAGWAAERSAAEGSAQLLGYWQREIIACLHANMATPYLQGIEQDRGTMM